MEKYSEKERTFLADNPDIAGLYEALDGHPRLYHVTRKKIIQTLTDKGGSTDDKGRKEANSLLRIWNKDSYRKYPSAIALARLVPNSLREAFTRVYELSDDKRKSEIVTICNAYLRNRKTLGKNLAKANFRGTLYEMVRIWEILKDNKEFYLAKRGAKIYVSYSHLRADGSSEWRENVQIKPDILLRRAHNGGYLPYAIELKNNQGGGPSEEKPKEKIINGPVKILNQLRRYQAAVDAGQLAGVTFETNYIPRRGFVKLLTEPEDQFPSIELITSLDLPTGNRYRFVYKASQKGNGLKFNNNRVAFERITARQQSDFITYMRFVHPNWLQRLRNLRGHGNKKRFPDDSKLYRAIRNVENVVSNALASTTSEDIIMETLWRDDRLSYSERLRRFWAKIVKRNYPQATKTLELLEC